MPRPAPGGAVEALVVRGVHKTYRGRVALAGVDLTTRAGEVVSLLGPNGAGKTTLVSVVAGLRRPDRGEVWVYGLDARRSPRSVRPLIGLAPQDTGVYLPLTVRDNLRLFAGLAGLHGAVQRARVDAVACSLLLEPLMGRVARDLSGGERRRLHTAIALVGRPRLVLLDEPTTGADVQTRTELLHVVHELTAEGASVLYTTHYLHEVEQLGGRIVCIDRGRIVAEGDLDQLLGQHGSSGVELTFAGPVPPTACALPGAVVTGSSVRLPTPDPPHTAATALAKLGADAASLQSVEILRPTLEAVFVSLTGRPPADTPGGDT